jgi:UDP-glucuronate 4-epimerase
MKTILITGHLGFIGKKLFSFLQKKYKVIGLDIKEHNDILDCELPDCDVVIHLAAKTGVRESLTNHADYWRVNVDGTRRILEHYNNKKILAASSSSQYEPYLNPYAATKHIAEKIPHTNVCWMRFHTVYSSEPRAGMFFDLLLNDKLQFVTDHERDFIHIADVCRAIELLIENSVTGPVDIGTGKTIKICDVCPELPAVAGSRHERQKTLANTELMTSIGFTPEIDVEEFIFENIRR